MGCSGKRLGRIHVEACVKACSVQAGIPPNEKRESACSQGDTPLPVQYSYDDETMFISI